jgi:competence protein ComEA
MFSQPLSGSASRDGSILDKINDFIDGNKYLFSILLIGLILIGFGIMIFKLGIFDSSDKVEVLKSPTASQETNKPLVVEISGAIEKPGVYKLPQEARIEDLLIASGGISASADRVWVEKFINRAAKLADGQKIYIYRDGEREVSQEEENWQTNTSGAKNDGGIKVDQAVLGANQSGLVNINTSSLKELDTLPGIGQVYGQSIIDHRPYSDIKELVSRGAIKESVYEKVKDKVTVY